MTITIENKKSEGAERLLQITIPVEQVDKARNDAARKIAAKVAIPGFRKGKAPPAMVLKRFGDSIRAEVLDSLVQSAYTEVLERENIKPATQPHIHDVTFDDGQPMTFTLHVEVRPDVVLARVEGFKVTRTERSVADEDVRAQLDQLREQRAAWSPVSEKALEGDMVTVQLATADESGAIPEGREYKIVIGAGQAIAGIEEVILELAPGTSIERPVKWPDDFPDEAERGKTKMVRVALQDVKRKSVPDLDDSFAREVGDFDSLAALEGTVRTDMVEAAKRESDADVRAKLLDEIIGANPFDIPPSWVKQLIDGYGNAYQIPQEEQGRFAEQFRPTAERQVRRDLVVDTLAERESLKATEGDIDDRITDMAKTRDQNPGQVYAALQKAGRLTEMERSITEEKVFAWLLERNSVE
jgi:trigger factor